MRQPAERPQPGACVRCEWDCYADRSTEGVVASLGDGASLGGQVETGPTIEIGMKSPAADNPNDLKMRSSGKHDPTVDDPEIGNPDADTPSTVNLQILKCDLLWRNVVT